MSSLQGRRFVWCPDPQIEMEGYGIVWIWGLFYVILLFQNIHSNSCEKMWPPPSFSCLGLRFQAQATSLGCGHVNAVDEEIVAVTVDHLQQLGTEPNHKVTITVTGDGWIGRPRLRKKAAERKVKFVLHHFQKLGGKKSRILQIDSHSAGHGLFN